MGSDRSNSPEMAYHRAIDLDTQHPQGYHDRELWTAVLWKSRGVARVNAKLIWDCR